MEGELTKRKPNCTCCTGSAPQDISMLEIKGVMVGVVGLEEVFLSMMQGPIEDEEELKEALLKEVSKRNYVPQRYEAEYKEALFQAYRSFLSEKGRKRV